MGIVTVTHRWDDAHGVCYDCGDPAAFMVPDAYRREDGSNADAPLTEVNLRCAVCAAQAACDGERVMRLWVDDDDPPVSDEHVRFLNELGIEVPPSATETT
jgi:hypothetical protein